MAVVHGYWCLVGLAGGMSVAGVADGSRVADGTSRCSCIVRARPPLNCSGVVSGAMPPIQSLGMWVVDSLWERSLVLFTHVRRDMSQAHLLLRTPC